MRLYSFFRSSAAYRVRIALNLKGVDYEIANVDLPGNRHREAEFRAVNPQATIPTLDDDGTILWQSLAIIDYLDARFPQPRLIPQEPVARAHAQALAQLIVCEIHPLNNLRVLRYLVKTLGLTEEQKNAWYRHWVEQGLASVEARLVAEGRSGRYVLGDMVTLADVLIVPQIFNAQRFDCNLDALPTVMQIFDNCMQLPAFVDARPAVQPDADS